MLLLVAGSGAHAAPADDTCEALRSARIHLVALMGATNKIALDNHSKQVHIASARLDTLLAAMIHGQNDKDASNAREFQPVWEAFKDTRETQIIPALYAGHLDAARGIALGIQGERMKKMKAIMGCK